jgi:hypothetical protein
MQQQEQQQQQQQQPQPPPPPQPAQLRARDNAPATYAPLLEAGEYRRGAVLVAVAAPTPPPGRSTPTPPNSPSDATSAEGSSSSSFASAQGLPPGSGTVVPEYDINSLETIRLCDELGVEWCADPDHAERQVGPLLMTDRGSLDLFVTDTVLMQKKRPNLKSIARKIKQVRWYGPRTGGKSRKPYTTDIPISHAREYVNGLLGLVMMAEKNPKPTFVEFVHQTPRDSRPRPPPGPGSACLQNMSVPPPPLPPAHQAPPLSYPHPPPSHAHPTIRVHHPLPPGIRALPLVRPSTPVATALAAVAGGEDDDGVAVVEAGG